MNDAPKRKSRVQQEQPDVLIVDSIQTLYNDELNSPAVVTAAEGAAAAERTEKPCITPFW